jgi:hypothetical protein
MRFHFLGHRHLYPQKCEYCRYVVVGKTRVGDVMHQGETVRAGLILAAIPLLRH